MRKSIKKKLWEGTVLSLTALFALFASVYITLRDPFVQTFIARITAAYLSEKLETKITLNGFYLETDLSVNLKGLVVYDRKDTVLLRSGMLNIQPEAYNFGKELELRRIELDNVLVQLIKHQGETDFNYAFFIDFFSSGSSADTSGKRNYPILIRQLTLNDARFNYIDKNKPESESEGMNYNAIQAEEISLKARNVRIDSSGLSATIRQFKAHEQCGFEISKLQADVMISSTGLKAHTLIVETPKSALRLDLELRYPDAGAFGDFIHEVELAADFYPSSLQMDEIGYFSSIMHQMPNLITFSGQFNGTISDFSAKDFSFSYGDRTSFLGSVEMKGLPDFYSTDILLSMNRLSTNLRDIEQFRIPTKNGKLTIPEGFVDPGQLLLNGVFEGRYNDFLARSGLKSDLGSLQTNLVVRSNKRTGKVSYKGGLKTQKLQLGKLLGQENLLGKLSMNVTVDGEGLTLETAKANVIGNIASIDFITSTFTDIQIKGDLGGSRFNGDFNIDDPKLKLDFEGLADFSGSNPDFDFKSTIHHADLFELGLLTSDSVMQLSTSFNATFTGFSLESFLGKIELTNTNYKDSRGSYLMENLDLISVEDPLLNRKLTLNSDFLDLELGGTFNFNKVVSDFRLYLLHYIDFAVNEEEDFPFQQDFYFNFKLKDTQVLTDLFLPNVSIAKGASFSGTFTNSQQLLNATFQTDWLGIGGIRFLEPYMLMQSNAASAHLKLDMERLSFYEGKEGDSSSFGMDFPALELQMHQDSVLFNLLWDNGVSKPRNKGKINGYYHHYAEEKAELKITNADIIINDSLLRLQHQNKITFTNDFIKLDHFGFQLGKSYLSLEGHVPLQEKDSLQIVFNGWDMSSFDVITKAWGVNLDGEINGDLFLSNFRNSPAFASNLHIAGLRFNGERLGEARIISTWSNEDASIYLNTQIINTGNVASSRMLNLRGFYYPTRKKDNLMLELALDNFRMKLLNMFFKGIISKVEGLATGDFKIRGDLNAPQISGDLTLQRTSFVIDYLNVAYSLQHQFRIEPDKILINDLYIIDTLGNQGVVQGVIRNENLRNFSFDINIRPDNLIALNTGPLQNELFYGAAVVTGDVFIRGPLNKIEMGIRAISQKGTSIVIPLNYIGSIGTNDYIKFVSVFNQLSDADTDKDPDLAQKRPPELNENSFEINLETVVTPDAAVQIFMPYNMGNLEARGSGNLTMAVNAAGDFSLNGDYIVRNGQFNFSFENLIKKRFDLVDGGRISWTGDPYDAEIDVKGIYKVKASLAGLGLDSTSSLRNRVNVDCIIHLTNQLFNPDIKFSFLLPGADPQVEQMVFSVIDTTNDALMTQQMISLLALGSFSYAAIDNFSIGATSFDMLSGQLSSWLSQISKDFDIGLHYRPGDNLTSEELEVALSTQLFNDRVTIDGNFGVINNRNAAQNASNIVGDFDISVKLTRDGRLQMKAFNHSNASNLISSSSFDRYAPYTQGIGLSFRQEFDAFSEIFRRKKQSIKNQQNESKQ